MGNRHAHKVWLEKLQEHDRWKDLQVNKRVHSKLIWLSM